MSNVFRDVNDELLNLARSVSTRQSSLGITLRQYVICIYALVTVIRFVSCISSTADYI